ncbi:hypothetical protein NoPa_00083 [Pseudomonas phage vB_PpuM-NoPa]|uniref:Glutaredoxin n=4 Tax=Tartuvirus TaxID=3424912 RepID=A0AAX4MWZ6_9CAUD
MMYIIYGKKDCAACDQAQKLLERKGVMHNVLKLDEDYDMEHLMEVCETLECVPPRSFPFIVKAFGLPEGEGDYALTLASLQMELGK